MDGEYKEKLHFGRGELIVTKKDYLIQFYFPGPDLRYNGTLVTIHRNMINKYIKALSKNWEKFLELKKMESRLGNRFSTTGELGMGIYLGEYGSGICIDEHHLMIYSEKELKKLLDSFRWALERGPKIVTFLNSMK